MNSPWISDRQISWKTNQGANVKIYLSQLLHRLLSQYLPCTSLDLQNTWQAVNSTLAQLLHSLCPNFCRQLCRVISWWRLSPSKWLISDHPPSPPFSFNLDLRSRECQPRWVRVVCIEFGCKIKPQTCLAMLLLCSTMVQCHELSSPAKILAMDNMWNRSNSLQETGLALISLCNFVHSGNIFSCW